MQHAGGRACGTLASARLRREIQRCADQRTIYHWSKGCRLFDFRRAPSGSSLTIGGFAGCSSTVPGGDGCPGSGSRRRAFHLLDQPVRALGPGVGEPRFRNPRSRATRSRLSRRGGELGDLRVGAPLVERASRSRISWRCPSRAEARTAREFLLRDPGGQDLPRRVVVDQPFHICASALGQLFPAAEQQPPVGPRRVGLAAASVERSRVTRCRTAVTVLLASMTRWKWSTTIGLGQGGADRRGVAGVGSITTT